jgi:hypothetical protein
MPDLFWSDDFDMDLPKIFPEAREIMGPLGDVELFTNGHTMHGRLNHPNVWNSHNTMLSFFGFTGPARPSVYHTSSELVSCTAWEAFRDAWSHSYLIQIEKRPIWDTFKLARPFEIIMWNIRGWDEKLERPNDVSKARRLALASYRAGIAALRSVCAEFGRPT